MKPVFIVLALILVSCVRVQVMEAGQVPASKAKPVDTDAQIADLINRKTAQFLATQQYK